MVDLHFRRFRSILRVEEFAQGAFLDRVDRVVIEPGRVTGNDDVMRLLARFRIVETFALIGIALDALIIRVVIGLVFQIIQGRGPGQLRIVDLLPGQG